MIGEEQHAELEGVATETISVFEKIAQRARERLQELKPPTLEALASANAFTMDKALRNLDQVATAQKEACERLAREPAIARVVAEDEEGVRQIFYIARGAAQAPSISGLKIASYHSETGRLAASSPGESVEIRLPSGSKEFDIKERALLHPREDREGWDSTDTVFESNKFGPVTIESLRRFLAARGFAPDEIDEVERLLQEEEKAEGVILGLRRKLIAKMGLRDQPILDRFQDNIFRLPLQLTLAVLGPPGTGKTTTLIRRLQQKLDVQNLLPDELASLERSKDNSLQPHDRSWLMFTPTELLRHYVKEAFAREGVAASDQRIRTWETHRRDLARNLFNILRAGSGRGTFVERGDEPSLAATTVTDSIGWFEDFQEWQVGTFWAQLDIAAQAIAKSDASSTAALGDRLQAVLKRISSESLVTRVLGLVDVSTEAREMLSLLRIESNAELRKALNLQLNHDATFIDSLATFIDTLKDGTDEPEIEDETETEDEDDERQPQTRRGAAINAYNAALRSQSRQALSGRRSRRGRMSKILAWIGERGLAEERRPAVGRNLILQRALASFSSPVRAYIQRTPQRYRAFRRLRRSEGQWYTDQSSGRYVNPLEVDLVLLAMLRGAAGILHVARSRALADHPALASLQPLNAQFRNQVLVDEATDFSPVQLACMAELCTPGVASFFACGDFNQRVTNWGTRTEVDLRWVRPEIEIRRVAIAYRQTRQLHEFARELVRLSAGTMSEASLPEHVENDGVGLVLGKGVDATSVVQWLSERIREIEAALRPNPLPSIAVLVNDEADVQPLADQLNAALEDHNLKAIACINGQMIGQENEVRVFNVEHIKGLEFEAVFFLAIDRLAERLPDLFDKYLYVGTTRAATYLGVTCEAELPRQIASLEGMFVRSWQ